MKKNKIFLIVTIIILVIILLIGGKFYMNKKEIQVQKNLLEVEKQSVLVLKNTFADITTIKVLDVDYHNTTGFYSIVITMTNGNGQVATFDYGFKKNNDELSDYGIVDRQVQKKGITTNKIKVIFSNGVEEEI